MTYTTLSDTDLLGSFRDFLTLEGLARTPRVSGSGAPLWLEPATGVPAPGEGGSSPEIGQDLVLAAFRSTGVPFPRSGGAYLRRVNVDLRMRARKAKYAYEADAAIYKLLHDRTAWDMAGFTVIESLQVRELQRMGSDAKSFDFITEYQFECYA